MITAKECAEALYLLASAGWNISDFLPQPVNYDACQISYPELSDMVTGNAFTLPEPREVGFAWLADGF